MFIYALSRAISDGVNAPYEIKPWTEPVNGSYQIVYTNRQDVRESLKRRQARVTRARLDPSPVHRYDLLGSALAVPAPSCPS